MLKRPNTLKRIHGAHVLSYSLQLFLTYLLIFICVDYTCIFCFATFWQIFFSRLFRFFWACYNSQLLHDYVFILIRAFEDEAKARLGVVECAKHELLQPFSVLHDKEGECWRPAPQVSAPTLSSSVASFARPWRRVFAFRRVCGPVQVHSAADGQRLPQNHRRTLWSRALQVGPRSAGPTAKGRSRKFSGLAQT